MQLSEHSGRSNPGTHSEPQAVSRIHGLERYSIKSKCWWSIGKHFFSKWKFRASVIYFLWSEVPSEAWSAEHSNFLIESKARSTESLPDVAYVRHAQRRQMWISLRVFMYIYFDMCAALDSGNWLIGYTTRQWRAHATSCLHLLCFSLLQWL